MATPDDLTATLSSIRERAERVWNLRGNVGGLLAVNEAKDDVPRLLRALDAVLKLAAEWRQESEALRDAAGKVWEDAPDAPGVRLKHAYAAGYAECAKALDAAITRELTKEAGDGNGV
jgi:hypothetical protein